MEKQKWLTQWVSRPADDFHGGFAVRGYRYAHPPVITLKHPVLRTIFMLRGGRGSVFGADLVLLGGECFFI